MSEPGSQTEKSPRPKLRALAQEALEAQMIETTGAVERGADGNTAGRSQRLLQPLADHRVGTLELRVPQDRDGRFSTELFQCY
jgi:putative transposase